MTIHDITIRSIFDSRGEETIEITLVNGERVPFSAKIPSGKSKGTREVAVFTVLEAHASVEKIKSFLVGKSVSTIGALDALLKQCDDTEKKEKCGGNVMLGISVAGTRAIAFEQKKEVWEVIREEYFKDNATEKIPLIFSNFINGGEHANNNLNIQEYLVVARTTDNARATVVRLIDMYRAMGELLKKQNNVISLPIGDEGGYSLNFSTNHEPLALLEAIIDENDLENEFLLGLDCAASSFGAKGEYTFEKEKRTREEMREIYTSYFSKTKLLLSIEDPYAEDDAEGFVALRRQTGDKWIVGDDLTTSSAKEIEAHAGEGAINAVIIKPNQIGLVSEACEAIRMAHAHNVKVIVSHRSGETEDAFIIHLAKACGADGVKIGAPVKERLIKFNEFIRLNS